MTAGVEVAETNRASRVSGFPLLDAALLGGIILALSLLGIFLRAHGLLSAFWAANAVLLGLMLRRPAFATPACLVAATAGFLLADLLTGAGWVKTLVLAAGNLTGVMAGYLFLRRRDAEDLQLRRPSSALLLVAGCAAASFFAGLVGIAANWLLFGAEPLMGFFYWFVTEFANYIAILPVILTATALPRHWPAQPSAALPGWRRSGPVLATLLGLALEPLLEGPGALAFPLPGLLWCALAYDVSVTALLTFGFAVWSLIAMTLGLVRLGMALNTEYDLISLRLGVTLMMLGPITVATVMSARNAMLREAAAARAAAEEAMASRSLLLATMAHELRSPLSAAIGLADILVGQNRGPLGDPHYVDYAQSIAEAGRHLNGLVTDLLDTAKVEAGKIEIAKAPVSSAALVEQALRLVRGLAMDAGVRLETLPGEWPDLYVDSRAIKQVMINLVSNAVKFSPRGTTITVAGECGERRLTIRVRDQGKGIGPEELRTLGRAYAQAGDAATRRRGTGLGLALSMELVAQHGGQLRLESLLGAGTTAIFDLPRDL